MLMDFLTVFLLILFPVISTCFLVLGTNSWYKRSSTKLPPGPFPIPFIGNLLQVGQNPHRSLAKLSKTYGPLMHLKLGSIHTIVVSSPEIAKEVLTKHDQACSGRAVPSAAHAMDHHKSSIPWLPVATRWRALRKIMKEQVSLMHQFDGNNSLVQLHNYLQDCSNSDRVVDIREIGFKTALNLLSSTLFSIDFAHFDSSLTREMMENVHALIKNLGTPNLVDYFPLLKFIDPQGLVRKTEASLRRLHEIFGETLNPRLQSRGTLRKKDMLEALLDLNQENESDFSLNDIKHLMLDLNVIGAYEITNAVQWTMTEVLRNPEKMSKAKLELRTIIGENKQIKESDISRLPYLNAVIKENFRCHPVLPLLIPHKVEVDIEIQNYTVPKNAQILVNVWAIGRDSSIWSNPDSFEPERFLDCKIDYRGQDFELITFSSGRRMCPALPLAHVVVHLILATLIHNFD
ncbi:hypothetical protein BUALT_Bualt08G0047000 [Buddleja alternifolia]|uniref:Cytochrome P450 n=1 Tax=Buddleja alternifolia TaxID=168488 RepID=A0AAV6X433_9LAMI|nr:hypothetical protein BUALT_Bualt08G0047000 [Buddleja alternifolia]